MGSQKLSTVVVVYVAVCAALTYAVDCARRTHANDNVGGVLRIKLRDSSSSSQGIRRALRTRKHESLVQVETKAGSVPKGPPPKDLFGTLYVGTPPQEFAVAFDTGSGNLMLPSMLCKSIACLSHRPYDGRTSATSTPIAFLDEVDKPLPESGTRETVRVSVGTGALSGNLVKDKVCLGPEENLCVKTEFIEALTMSDEPFSLLPYDGILGLAMPGTSLSTYFNYMGNIAEAQSLKSNRFSVWMAKAGIDTEDSEITFGAFSEERMGSAITWHAVAKPETGMWQIVLNDLVVNNAKLDLCRKGCMAAFDTGTAVIGGPTATIKAVIAELDVKVDCTNYDKLPLFGFVFGDTTLKLSKEDYVMKTNDGCYTQFFSIDIPPPKGPLMLLGDPFLRRYYTIYDRDSLRIGVAFARHASEVGGDSNDDMAAKLIVQTGSYDQTASA